MWFSDKSGTARAAENPLPPKIASLLRESWWLAMVALALYLALILFTFNRADPGWSHGAGVDKIINSGGRVGAWVADLLLFVFGATATMLFAVVASIALGREGGGRPDAELVYREIEGQYGLVLEALQRERNAA